MKNLISYFIRYPISADVLLLVILVFGLFGLANMRSTFFPESETKIIAVQITYPGASPEEVEEGIVAKIEDNLKGLTGLDRVTSVSSENTGRLLVEIKRGQNVDLLLQDVKNAVDQINSFPEGMESPVIYKQEILTRALNFVISGDTDLGTLKRFARKIESDLLAAEGISKVELSGFPEEEIEISVRENTLRAYGLTFDQVAQAVRSSNLEITGGTIKADEEEYLIRSRSKGYFAEEFVDIVVATSPDGRKVLLRDIATVRDRWADTPNRTYVNGKPGVGINVSNTIDENLLDISDYVRDYIEKFNAENELIQATIISDGSVTLRQRIDLLTNNGLIGFFLVIFFLTLFLQVRLAFWVAISIPISIAGMFIIAPLVGLSINVLTLFGMILVIGILVDDGIVVSENIYQHYESGKDRFKAALDGTMEVLPAVFSAILTTMVAFGTFLFLAGIVGDFFSELAVVVILTLAFALVEGSLILPTHVAHSKALHRKGDNEDADSKGVGRFFSWLLENMTKGLVFVREKAYAPSLRFFLRYPVFGIAIPLALLLITFGLVAGGQVKVSFFPVVEGDYLNVSLKLPAGTREAQTMKWLNHIELATWAVNEDLKAEREDGKDVVLVVQKNLGPTTYEGGLLVQLLDTETRNMSSLKISELLREKAGPIYGAEQVTYGRASAFGKPVSVALAGENLEELQSAADELKSELEEYSDLRDVTDNNQLGLREINIKLKEKARILGLDPRLVVSQVRQGFFGAEVQRLQRGQDEVKVWVRYEEGDRSSVGQLEEMRIRLPDGSAYPLREIATLEWERGVIAINRLDGKRAITVEAELASADVSTTDVNTTIEEELLPPILAQHPGVSYSFEGQVRENGKFLDSAKIVLPIAMTLILVIIILTFRSFGQTISVMSTLPFGLIGVFLGHFLLGKTFSIALSGLGVFALIGVMVNDSLVLVSAHNGLIAKGKPFKEALEEAAKSRFRPIILTSLTTIAGLAPLIVEKSFQAQFLIPMAISVAFGLAVATFAVLFTLPVLLTLFNNYKVLVVWLWEGNRPDATSVEPALENRKNYILLWLSVPVALIALFAAIFLLAS